LACAENGIDTRLASHCTEQKGKPLNKSDAKADLNAQGTRHPSKQLVEDWLQAKDLTVPQQSRLTGPSGPGL
jgi:hypothetical protein